MFTKLRLWALLVTISFAGSIFATSPSTYQKGWEAFLKNDRKNARLAFLQALKQPQTKADALLSLSLLDWTETKEDRAFNHFRSFFENSTNPYPYLYAMFTMPYNFASRTYLPAERVAFLEQVIADPKLNGTLKAMVGQHLGSFYEFNNKNQKAKEYFSGIGNVNNWQVLGTFENISGSGFAKNWGAVSKPLPGDVFKNKVDADVKWYTPTYNRPDKWFCFDYYFSFNSTIMYAQSFITSPLDQEVYMRAGTSGSLKIWVNDALIASVPEERNCDLDIYSYKIKLNKGVNRILVQIGQSEIDNANFLLRLTDAEARPIKGLTDQANYAPYSKDEVTTTQKMQPFFAETYFEQLVQSNPANYLNYVILAETYLHNDKAFEATQLLKGLEARIPGSSLISNLLAEAYIRAKNQTDYDKEMENIKRNDPESFIALNELYTEAIKSEKYSEALDICNKTKALYGESFTTQQWQLSVASYQKRIDDVIAIGKKLYAQYPYNYDLMNLSYNIENNISKNSPASTAVVEDFCSKYYSPNALGTLANIYFEQGKTEQALDTLKHRIEVMPYATGYRQNLASIYYQMQRYDEALKTTDSVLQLSPYVSGIYNTRGYIFKAMKNVEKAKESFAQSIYYDPTSYDSRSQLRLLEGKKEVFDLFSKKDLKNMIAKAPSAQEYPEDNSIILLNDNQLVVYPEGAKEYHNELAVKILNQAGIENWKQYGIDFNSNTQKLIIDKSEVIKASGNVVKAESDNNTVVFTNLEVGDVLHLDYRIQDFSTGVLAKQFFDQFLFQYTIPSVINRYSILAPKDKEFRHNVVNGSVTPVVSDVEGMKLYSWESDNQPAVKTEPYMSPLVDVSPLLSYTSIPDWNFISNWYKDITTSKFNSDYVLKETLASILKGHEQDGPLQKAKLFYEYILQNISYSDVSFMHSNFVPQKASRTITTRLGDCKDVATLFVALCREAGLDANLVLISTRDNGRNQLVLPTINFNHCIAQLNVDQKAYYLELTDQRLPFGAAETSDLKSNILPIPFNKEPIGKNLLTMDMPFRPLNAIYSSEQITLTGNDLQLSRRASSHGALASYLRNTYSTLGRDEQLKTFSQAVASDFSAPVKVTDLSFTNLDNLADSVVLECKIEVKKAMQDVAGMKILTLPWTYKINSLEDLNLEKRNTPFEFWAYSPADLKREKLQIILPQGMSFVELPQNVHLECPNASYDLVFNKLSDGSFEGTRTFRRTSEFITTDHYPAFREFITHVSEADNKQYAIK